MNVIQVSESLQHCQRYFAHNIDINGPDLLVDSIQRALVHEFHTNADIGVGYECAVEGDDIVGVAVMHDLEFAEDLFPHGGLSVDQDNLAEVVQP